MKSLFKNNQYGFSMVQVLIATAMVGILSVVIMRLGFNSSKIQKQATTSTEINQIVNRIEKQLMHSDGCRWSLGLNDAPAPAGTGANLLGSIIGGKNNAVLIDRLVDLKGYPYIQIDEDITPNIRVQEIRVERGDGSAYPPFEAMQSHNLRLSITFQKKNDGIDDSGNQTNSKRRSFGANVITKHFYIDAVIDQTTDEVTSCYSTYDNAISTALISACENSLGGTYLPNNDPTIPDCTNTVLHQALCAVEVKLMQATGTAGTTSCGVTYELVDVTSLETSNGTFIVPSDMAGTNISVKILGGGGGGGGSDHNEPGGGGSSGEIRSVSFNMKIGDTCTWTLGAGGTRGEEGNGWGDSGSGGDKGGTTSINCAGAVENAEGGNGGCGECRGPGESCGWSAQDSNGASSGRLTFAGTNYGGGNRGCRRQDGQVGEYGVGGGGAGDRKQRGGTGGSGLVWIKYEKIQVAP